MRYNLLIVQTVFYDLPNCTDRKVVVSNRVSLCIRLQFKGYAPQTSVYSLEHTVET